MPKSYLIVYQIITWNMLEDFVRFRYSYCADVEGAELTHPVIAALDHLLSALRKKDFIKIPLFCVAESE
jgi:hypothetical protein